MLLKQIRSKFVYLLQQSNNLSLQMKLCSCFIATAIFILIAFGFARSQDNTTIDYTRAIESADKYFAQDDFLNAKAYYQMALVKRPDDTYSKKQLDESIRLLKEKLSIVSQYNSLVQQADKLFESKQYAEARTKYLEASRIKPEETHPDNRIKEITDLLAQAIKQDNEFEYLIKSGDSFFGKGQYNEAKAKFEEALAIKPDDLTARQKLQETAQQIDGQELNEQSFSKLITSGDQNIQYKKYTLALQDYNEALKLKPGDTKAMEKIRQAGDAVELQSRFDKLVNEADELYISKDYSAAKAKYQEASALLPKEKYPGDMITKIIFALQSQKSAEELYSSLIASADNLFSSGQWASARKEYENALQVKPGETYPAAKIREVDLRLQEISKAKQDYQDAVSRGDALYSSEQYEKALTEYRNAQVLDPLQTYPGQQLIRIETLLNERKSAEESEKLLNFEKFKTSADKNFEKKDYPKAIADYNEALKFKPNDPVCKAKLNEIDKIQKEQLQQQQTYEQIITLADKFYNNKQYELAMAEYQKALVIKPNEKYPSDRIKEINKIIENQVLTNNYYNQTLSEADTLFAREKYNQAITAYQNASKIKPNEQYPRDRVNEINKLIENQKQQQLQYSKAISEADDLFKKGFYSDARTRYQNATQVKPDENYPKQKLVEIDKLLGEIEKSNSAYQAAIQKADLLFNSKDYTAARLEYTNALSFKPSEKYPAEKINQVDKILNEDKYNTNRYNLLLADADRFFQNKEYSKAKDYYNQASAIKNTEQYPKDKITEIDLLLVHEQQQIITKYQAAIKTADSCFNTGDYESALNKYGLADRIKPDEQYPDDRIAQIKVIQADKLQKRDSWQKLVSAADALFKAKDYKNAITKYQEATSILPDEKYPTGKIAEINTLLENEKNEELQTQYLKIIVQADQLFKAKDYEKAKTSYSEALKIKASEQYPRDKIDEINRLALENQQQKSGSYNKIIADADKYFLAKAYDQAVDLYRQAIALIPGESYPADMISKISAIMEENSQITIVNSPTIIEQNQTTSFTFTPVPVADREKSYIILKLRNSGDTQFKVLMSFGKDNSKSGGIIIKMIPGTNDNEYIFRVGTQYSWFSIDNNYISLYPEGGNIEVLSVKISRSN